MNEPTLPAAATELFNSIFKSLAPVEGEPEPEHTFECKIEVCHAHECRAAIKHQGHVIYLFASTIRVAFSNKCAYRLGDRPRRRMVLDMALTPFKRVRHQEHAVTFFSPDKIAAHIKAGFAEELKEAQRQRERAQQRQSLKDAIAAKIQQIADWATTSGYTYHASEFSEVIFVFHSQTKCKFSVVAEWDEEAQCVNTFTTVTLVGFTEETMFDSAVYAFNHESPAPTEPAEK